MKKTLILPTTLLLLIAGVGLWFFSGQPSVDSSVVVYVSEDQVFSEPILRDFQRETGIEVKAVYDTEETKSTGVMNRLLAEKHNPQADVFWANEPIRAEVLKQERISAPYRSVNSVDIPARFKDPDGYWTGFSARARVLVVHNNVESKPQSILAYSDPRWFDKAVLANPLFGTTTAEMAALFTLWGNERTEDFFTAMKRNLVTISTSNGESTDFVAARKYEFSLVDSDDAVNRIRQGKPLTMIYPDQGENEPGCFIVPNTVVLIRNSPHPESARLLIDYLLSRETEKKLAFADCAQIPLHPQVQTPAELIPIKDLKVMQVNYGAVAKKLVEIQPFLKSWVEQ